jgi:DNA-binding transcriptional LysR family regulator
MQSLRLFCNVARHQSFSRAAGELGITQSAASQRIQSLEKRLGVKLFDRSVRPLALTAAGEIYFREVRDLLDRFEQLEARIGALTQVPTGQVRVDAIYSAGVDLLRHIEKAFAEACPQVTVAIHYRRPEEVYDAVRRQQCDLGILSYPQRWRGVAHIPLRDEVMAVVCSPKHPLAGRPSVNAAQLHPWPMVTFERDLPVARKIKAYLRASGADPQVVNVFDNIDTIKTAVAGTDRFAILPKRTVLRDVAAGTLAVVELLPELMRPLGIIHRKRNGTAGVFTPAVAAFVDFLLEHAGPHSDVVDEADARGRQMVGGKV